MRIPEFALERYFARWEFEAPCLLGASASAVSTCPRPSSAWSASAVGAFRQGIDQLARTLFRLTRYPAHFLRIIRGKTGAMSRNSP